MIEDKNLLAITDGDIRRGLLKDLSLTDKVLKIIKKKPITINENLNVNKNNTIIRF